MNDRMIIQTFDAAARAVRMSPIGSEFERPPLPPVVEVCGTRRRLEDKGAGPEHMRKGAGIVGRVRRQLGEANMTGRFDELPELAVRYWRHAQEETIDRYLMRRGFFGIVAIRSHPEGSSGNPRHSSRG